MMVALGTEKIDQKDVMVALAIEDTVGGVYDGDFGTAGTQLRGVRWWLCEQWDCSPSAGGCDGVFEDSGDTQKCVMVALGTERTQQEYVMVVWGQ